MGSNNKGQLGLGRRDYKLRSSPSLIENLCPKEVIEISTGSYHSFAITADRDVFSWGSGEFGQLGLGDYLDTFTPTKVIFSSKYTDHVEIFKIDSGPKHTMMLSKRNTVFCCGDNKHGQLGVPSKSRVNKPILCRYIQDNIIDVACGAKHTLFLTGK